MRRSNSGVVGNPGSSSCGGVPRSSRQQASSNPTQTNITISSGIKCFGCGETGHRRSECKKRDKKALFADTDDGEEDDAYVGEEPAFDDTPDEEILEDALSRRSMLLTTMRVEVLGFDSFRDLLDTDPYFSVIMAAVRAVNQSSGFSLFQVVYSMLPHGPLDLIPLPSKIRAHGKAAEFVDGLQAIHKKLHDNLVQAATKYKMLADKKRRHVEFEIIEKINPNAYRLKLPTYIRTADVFNVKHLIPYFGDSSNDDAIDAFATSLSMPVASSFVSIRKKMLGP
ncbi:hypothetical protein MRB53_005946 [Persea americana]|uniref:Uncharacterized protein n=1 Tax=Persea americana TaxID=3435 RepID=A0ACC2MF22_PERAE|nr:hypothetical protein MRB53_005946 [Persea americana]